jgi:hypothetical protein
MFEAFIQLFTKYLSAFMTLINVPFLLHEPCASPVTSCRPLCDTEFISKKYDRLIAYR